MKAIIIENEYEVENCIKALLKDNPDLFESVQEELYCLHRPAESLLPEVLKNDAIIVASTWMYKDQVEEFIDGFLKPEFPKKMKIFLHYFTNELNSWKHGWGREKELFDKVKQLIVKGFELYEFGQDHDLEGDIMDGLNSIGHWDDQIFPRHKTGYDLIKWDQEADLFYNKFYSLEDERETEIRWNKKS